MIQCARAIIITKIFVEHSILTGSNLYERLTKLINLELADMRAFLLTIPNIFCPIPNPPFRLLAKSTSNHQTCCTKRFFYPSFSPTWLSLSKSKCVCVNKIYWTGRKIFCCRSGREKLLNQDQKCLL